MYVLFVDKGQSGVCWEHICLFGFSEKRPKHVHKWRGRYSIWFSSCH